MLTLVIAVDDSLQADCSFIVSIEAGESLANQSCYFFGHRVFNVFQKISIQDEILPWIL